jgi:hypothetical protein
VEEQHAFVYTSTTFARIASVLQLLVTLHNGIGEGVCLFFAWYAVRGDGDEQWFLEFLAADLALH